MLVIYHIGKLGIEKVLVNTSADERKMTTPSGSQVLDKCAQSGRNMFNFLWRVSPSCVFWGIS